MHPDLIIFCGITFIPIALLVRYRRLAGMDSGVLLILVGTGILSLAALVDYLEDTILESAMRAMANKDAWSMLLAVFGYIPGIFFTGLGLSRWFQVVTRLEKEVSRRKKAEAELLDLTKQLKLALANAEEASRAKTEFLAKMSHELRTPLNAIIGFSEVMNMQLYGRLGGERYEEYSGLIHSSGKLLLDIINDILDLSKVEAGHMELEEEAFFLHSLVKECLPIVESQADTAGLAVLVETDDDSVLWADRRIVKQMLLNLLSNSLKFTAAGGTIRIKSYTDGESVHVLEVKDSGIGMSPAEVKIALEPFAQVHSVMINKHNGTGLGLSLVKTFMELHGGKFEIESEQGKGTCARLTFPQERAVSSVAAE